MENQKKILSIVLEDGTVDEVELLLAFEFNDTKKEYAVYTKNERDESGNITIYVSSVTRDGDKVHLGSVETDDDWAKVKDVLRELSKN